MTNNKIWKGIPSTANSDDVLNYIFNNSIDGAYLDFIKSHTKLTDERLSNVFNINVKTFNSYKSTTAPLKENFKEHTIMLLSLYKHGEDVFDSNEDFNYWLLEKNFFLDNKAPIDYLGTISGIKHIDNRLTALEYGDNV